MEANTEQRGNNGSQLVYQNPLDEKTTRISIGNGSRHRLKPTDKRSIALSNNKLRNEEQTDPVLVPWDPPGTQVCLQIRTNI